MICSMCGNKIPDGSIFCNMCGVKISNNKAINIKLNNIQRKNVQEELNEIISYFSENVPHNNIITAIHTRS